MRINKRVGWLLCTAAILGFGSALNAAPIVLVNDAFEQENLGDTNAQLTNWLQQGSANGVIIDTDPGAGVNKALQIGQGAGILKNNLNLTTGNPGYTNPVKLSIKFDFTDVAPNNDWFALFWRDTAGSNPLYRLQWNPGTGGSGAILLKKTDTQLGASFGVPAGFWSNGATHTIELTILFDPGSDSMSGTNTLELFLGGVSQGTRQDIGGVTNDHLTTGNLRRLLPNATSSITLQNFNNEASALNILDNVSISYNVIPEPASLALLGLGGLMIGFRGHRRRDA
ncbi:MAG: PEP-CTERM sorting domain-containing protein [Phycisphaerales bacterium]